MPLELRPGEEKPFASEVTLDDELWGHEVRCALLEDGRERAAASECFPVHTNPWAVAIGSMRAPTAWRPAR